MSKVIGLGACVYDTLINCDTFPKEDTKYKSNGIFVAGGGPVGNSLVVLKKLGTPAGVLGLFAGDDAGKYLINDFIKYGIETKGAKVLDDKSSFCSYILLAEDSMSRTCVFNRGNVPDDPSLLDLSVIDDASVLHLDGNYIKCAIKAATYAKEKGIKVCLDAGGLYEGIKDLLPLVDILIPSAEFAEGLTGKNDIPSAMDEIYKNYAPEVLVVTDGKNGGYYYENGKAIHYDSYKIKAVDTNGAGDTFHGAFLHAYLEGRTIKECCNFSSAVSAYKCMHKGVRTAFNSIKEIEDFIKNN